MPSRITVPVAADGWLDMPSGRQTSSEKPYISLSRSSPGAVNSGCTASSITTVTPSGAVARRAVARNSTGAERSWTHSKAKTAS